MVAQVNLAFIKAISKLKLSPGLLRELRKVMVSKPKGRAFLHGEANAGTGATIPDFGCGISHSQRSTNQLTGNSNLMRWPA